MTIEPSPDPHELAALLVVLERELAAVAPPARPARPSRWRAAARDYASARP